MDLKIRREPGGNKKWANETYLHSTYVAYSTDMDLHTSIHIAACASRQIAWLFTQNRNRNQMLQQGTTSAWAVQARDDECWRE